LVPAHGVRTYVLSRGNLPGFCLQRRLYPRYPVGEDLSLGLGLGKSYDPAAPKPAYGSNPVSYGTVHESETEIACVVMSGPNLKRRR